MDADDQPPPSGEETTWYTEQAALLYSTIKWTGLGALAGACAGLGTRIFLWALNSADHQTARLPYYYLLLPLALPLCVWLVRAFAPTARGHGTEAVITAIHTRSGRIDLSVAPIKLLATVITLAAGGSVGKEGPCAQIGASIASAFADILHLSDEDRRRLVICGVGGGFAAVFGTPISGALFGVEVLYLGRIEYQILFPCIVAGITAHLVCGSQAPIPLLRPDAFLYPSYIMALLSIVAGAWFGLIALLLIESMHGMERLVHGWAIRNPYKVAAGGGIFLALFNLLTHGRYAQLGVPTIDMAMAGFAVPAFAWLFKLATTTVTLETGGSGGIITPLFFIGSTAGAAFAHLFHLSSGAFAAFGFVAIVAAAANTPIAASVMGLELLPAPLSMYAALCACTAYLIVGHRSVYSSQKLGMSKSQALDAPMGVTMGEVSRRDVTVRAESQFARLTKKRIIIRPKKKGKP